MVLYLQYWTPADQWLTMQATRLLGRVPTVPLLIQEYWWNLENCYSHLAKLLHVCSVGHLDQSADQMSM